MYKEIIKPIFDFLFSLTVLLMLSPIFLFISVFLFIAIKGNPFFTQARPGKNEKIFKVIKFKTMNDKRNENGVLLPDGDRLTKIGKFMRITSLDEIPQLINLLKGDMSLIGPRPLLPRYLPFYNEIEKKRHSIKPGITGMAQINGRNLTDWDKRLAFDVKYVDNLSFQTDLSILFKSIAAVLNSKGVIVDPGKQIKDLDNERLIIQECTPDNTEIKSIVYLQQLIFNESKLNNKLVYFDPNYPNYLKNLIKTSDKDLIYVIKINGIIKGFLHFKLFDSTIFLNNISLDKEIQGKGMGKIFLLKSLEMVNKKEYLNFELDVLASNNKALKWYQKLGLKVESEKKWNELIPKEYPNNDSSNKLFLGKDENGFSSLYFNKGKVATHLDKVTIIHDLSTITHIPLSKNKSIITDQYIVHLGSDWNVEEIEISYRMKGNIDVVYNKLLL